MRNVRLWRELLGVDQRTVIEGIEVEEFEEEDADGDTLTNAAGVGAAPIAEWVVGRVLQVYKRFDQHTAPAAAARLDRGARGAARGPHHAGGGRRHNGFHRVAVRLRAFGVHTIGVKRSYTPGMTDPSVDELIGPDDLLGHAPHAHVVVVAAPGTDDNEDLFDAAAFAAMSQVDLRERRRGTLVDEGALIDALRAGHLRPPPSTSPATSRCRRRTPLGRAEPTSPTARRRGRAT